MTPYKQEELENLRRIAERGKKEAEDGREMTSGTSSMFLDIFTHMLDTIQRIQNETKTTNS